MKLDPEIWCNLVSNKQLRMKKIFKDNSARQTLYIPFLFIFMREEKFIKTEKTGRSDLFPEGTDGMSLHLGVAAT